MLILYFLILILALWKIRVRPGPSAEAALSIEQTTMVKGIFVLLVFASHVSQYLTLDAFSGFLTSGFLFVRHNLGQLIVVPFLFYSGYGIRCSIEKKGTPYLRSFPRKRILRVYLHSALIVALFLVLQLLLGKRYTLLKILSGFLFWGNFGNSNWYLFAVLLLYFFTWLSFSIFQKRSVALSACFFFTAVYCFVLSRLAQFWWYDTVLVYWFGLLYPDLQSIIQSLLRRGTAVWFGAVFALCVMIAILTRGIPGLPHAILENLRSILLMLLVNLFLERIQIGNRLLYWLGNHVFECYLLQRIPMILLAYFGVQTFSTTLFVCASAAATVTLVLLIRKLLESLDRRLFVR